MNGKTRKSYMQRRVVEYWQKRIADKPLGIIIHRLKPVWCTDCDAYHVECDNGCCAQTS